MKRFIGLFAGVFLVLTPFCVHGQVSLDEIKHIVSIDTNDLKRIYDTQKDFLLINTLSPIEYAEQHIKGSINIPYSHLKNGKVKLPDDKKMRLIFYCKGPK